MIYINYAGRYVYAVCLKEEASIESYSFRDINIIAYGVYSRSKYTYAVVAVTKAFAVVIILKNKTSVKIAVGKGSCLPGCKIYRVACGFFAGAASAYCIIAHDKFSLDIFIRYYMQTRPKGDWLKDVFNNLFPRIKKDAVKTASCIYLLKYSLLSSMSFLIYSGEGPPGMFLASTHFSTEMASYTVSSNTGDMALNSSRERSSRALLLFMQ